MQENTFNLKYTYLNLPEIFFSKEKPSVFIDANVLLWNENVSKDLDFSANDSKNFVTNLIKNQVTNADFFSQAYAGHQFGHFTKLGDGRAIVLGEYVLENNQRIDLQLKGSGRTSYSRGGDGKATSRAMLREYLISEAMFHLHIPTSRSLAVITTGEKVIREKYHGGTALIRIMKSHIRVGTFEFAARFGTLEDVKALTSYTIKRLYPEILEDENLAISFLKKVMESQIDLVLHWMRVGFIHGVMNTDNTAISGETFDYGPCAFMNTYHPETVFSSIDHQGRYSYENQGKIIKWNLARLAEALIPQVHENKDIAIKLLLEEFEEFDRLWNKRYYEVMLKKIGLENQLENTFLWDELLQIMEKHEMDFTNTFLYLTHNITINDIFSNNEAFKNWEENWKKTIDNSTGIEKAKTLMQESNPVVIPRNLLVEKALDHAENGNMDLFNLLLKIISNPYQYQENYKDFFKPPDIEEDKSFQTYCGT